MPKGPHVRLTWLGCYGPNTAPIERWQFGLSIDVDPGAGDLTTGLVPQVETNIHAAMLQVWQGLRPFYPTEIALLQTDSRLIGGDGKQPRNAQGQFVSSKQVDLNQVGTGSGTPKYGPGTALCVSLGSFRAGPTGKGRLFLPAPQATLGSDFRLEVTVPDGVDAAFATGIKAINDAAAPDPLLGVVSIMSSKGYSSPVKTVGTGRVLDQMSSRRRNLLEGKTFNNVPA